MQCCVRSQKRVCYYYSWRRRSLLRPGRSRCNVSPCRWHVPFSLLVVTGRLPERASQTIGHSCFSGGSASSCPRYLRCFCDWRHADFPSRLLKKTGISNPNSENMAAISRLFPLKTGLQLLLLILGVHFSKCPPPRFSSSNDSSVFKIVYQNAHFWQC